MDLYIHIAKYMTGNRLTDNIKKLYKDFRNIISIVTRSLLKSVGLKI